MPEDIASSILDRFEAAVGKAGIVTDARDLAPHLTEWRGLYAGQAPVMIAPADTGQAADVLRICQSEKIGVVPQGGNTGLVGGAIPHSTPDAPQILLSAGRMKSIRELDGANYTITAEAGCLLTEVQAAAESADRLFPLSLAAEGSCQLGGNISTNAGGTNVLRYGNTRDLVLGLEVVLPDGRLYEGLRGLRKDNTGYDLKQLFIGAEGTLGFITAATCKLFPRPRSVATAMAAVPDADAAIEMYGRAREALGDRLVAFELINRVALDMVLEHIPDVRNPLSGAPDWCVLLELGSAEPGQDADHALEAFLASAMEGGQALDVALAQSVAQRDAFWRIRHSISEAERLAGAGFKHDVSIPLSRLGEFLRAAESLALKHIPKGRVVAFGHLGDGNLHYNLSQPAGMETTAFMALRPALSGEIHSLAVDMGGSFSAEHGIGMLKRDELQRLTDAVKLDVMREIKTALDPAGIMNPGKILPMIVPE